MKLLIPPGEGATIVVAVGDMDLRRLLTSTLAPAGYELKFMEGQLAIAQAAADEQTAYLFLDMTDLGSATLEITRAVRKNGDGLPILILAGEPQRDNVFAVLRAGADDFVRKPVGGPDHIALAMRRLVRYKTCIADNLRLKIEQEKAVRERTLSLDKIKFFRFASHELKSPLVSIRSSLKVIHDITGEGLDETSKDLLGRAIKRSDQLLGMITELLALSVERADRPEYYQETNLCQIIREAVEEQSAPAREKGVHLEMRLPDEGCRILCSRFALEKTVTNLVSNGVRYTPSGGRVIVSLENRDKKHIVRVQDTGIGIPESDHEKIWGEFYRSRNARDMVPYGSGLGLALVKKVIEEHGGWIDLESTEGQGSTFTIWLPHRKPS